MRASDQQLFIWINEWKFVFIKSLDYNATFLSAAAGASRSHASHFIDRIIRVAQRSEENGGKKKKHILREHRFISLGVIAECGLHMVVANVFSIGV